MRLAIQGRAFVAALAIIAAALLAAGQTQGEEPKCRLVETDGIPLLSKIPYVSRLFKNTIEAKADCAEEAERIGIDFDLDGVSGQVIEFHGPPGVCPETCAVCPLSAVQAAVAKCASSACPADAGVAAAKCCLEGKCCSGGKCQCSAECCQLAKDEKAELWEHVAELTAENAAMEAALEGHEALLEAKGEMFESVAALMVEKAKLEAKLEMVEHRDSMLKEMVELQAENATLKAQAELAQQQEELLKSQLATVLENERLKQRVAELEQFQRDGALPPVFAEKKQPKAKKSR